MSQGAYDNELSDYGSDIDIDDELLQIIHNASSNVPQPKTPLSSFADTLPDEDLHIALVERAVAYPQLPSLSDSDYEGVLAQFKEQSSTGDAIDKPTEEELSQAETDVKLLQDLTPFERYRRRRKGLTVTDLVSNIWCEQQYEYTLIRGYRIRTPKMKAGTDVHRKLEEKVHTIVPVSVTTDEDTWGLKLFNMFQGLQGLRQEGIARELPVFGFLGGIYVSGIIDEIVYVDPTASPATNVTKPSLGQRKYKNPNPPDLIDPELQTRFQPSSYDERVLFVSDNKTRGSKTLPGPSQVRASALQLMIYHRLLMTLRSNEVDFSRILEHYNLNGNLTFSDAFLAGIASIAPEDKFEEVLHKNTLSSMWDLVQTQTAKTFKSVGKKMGITYRNQTDGAFMARQDVYHDDSRLDRHLDHTLKWWRGERSTVGVDIEEAWKCRSCEFEAKCTWRLARLAEIDAKIAKRREAAMQKFKGMD